MRVPGEDQLLAITHVNARKRRERQERPSVGRVRGTYGARGEAAMTREQDEMS